MSLLLMNKNLYGLNINNRLIIIESLIIGELMSLVLVNSIPAMFCHGLLLTAAAALPLAPLSPWPSVSDAWAFLAHEN